MSTEEVIRKIHATGDYTTSKAIARDACSAWMDERDVIATQSDNGWSTSAIYTMPDGGEIRLDGRGFWATLPDGQQVFSR
jgi:hypothetical protein